MAAAENARDFARCALAAAFLYAALGTPLARAHGGPPSALGVVAAGEGGQLTIVALNEGLAMLRDERWSFVCPGLWGNDDLASNKVPLALSADGDSTWIIGADDLYLAREGAVTAQALPGQSGAHVVALAADGDALYGLSFTGEGSAIVRIGAAAQDLVYVSSEFWASFAIDADAGRWYLARTTPEPELALVLVTLDREGRVLDETSWPLAVALTQVRLRATSRGLFAVTAQGESFSLLEHTEDGWAQRLQDSGEITGPVTSASGALWIARDGELLVDRGSGFESVSEARRITCLNRWNELAYACAGSELYRLGDAGLEERLFHLEGFTAPDPALVPAEVEEICGYQWLLFRNDLELGGFGPRDWPAPSEPAPGEPGGGRDAGPEQASGGAPAAPPPKSGGRAGSGGCSAAGRDAHGAGAPLLVAGLAALALCLLRARRPRTRAALSATSPRSCGR